MKAKLLLASWVGSLLAFALPQQVKAQSTDLYDESNSEEALNVYMQDAQEMDFDKILLENTEAGQTYKIAKDRRQRRGGGRPGSSFTWGDSTFYSRGGSSFTWGDSTFYSRGGSSFTWGDTTFYSGGGSCFTWGDSTFCN